MVFLWFGVPPIDGYPIYDCWMFRHLEVLEGCRTSGENDVAVQPRPHILDGFHDRWISDISVDMKMSRKCSKPGVNSHGTMFKWKWVENGQNLVLFPVSRTRSSDVLRFEHEGDERELCVTWVCGETNILRWDTSFSERTKLMDLVSAARAVGI